MGDGLKSHRVISRLGISYFELRLRYELVILVIEILFYFYSETGGLGVKMVEYVLGSSPTTPKDLEPRMASLRMVRYIFFLFYSFFVRRFLKVGLFFVCLFQNADGDKKEKDKGAASPFDGSKDDNGPQGNGLASQNGLDDDKGFK